MAEITLTWQDNSDNETGFSVERSDDGLTGWAEVDTVGPNVETFLDTGLTGGNTYFYRVRAFNATKFSGYSNIASAIAGIAIEDLNDIILYLDADTTFAGASHNQEVSSWTDLSGNGYHQVQGTSSLRPKVQVTSNTSPNGKVLVRWDGVDDVLSSGTPNDWPSAVNGYTLYWYGRLKDNGNFNILWRDPATTRPQVGYMRAANDKPFVRTEADGTAVKNLHGSNIFSNLMQLFAVVFKTNGTVQAYRALSNGLVVALDQNPTYVLGSVVNNTGIDTGINCLMDLAAMAWIADEHDINTIKAVRASLRNKYGED